MIPRAASVAAWRGHPRPLCSPRSWQGNDAERQTSLQTRNTGRGRGQRAAHRSARAATWAQQLLFLRCRLRLRLPLHFRQNNNGFVYYTTQATTQGILPY